MAVDPTITLSLRKRANDLNAIATLAENDMIDADSAATTITSITNHLWQHCTELVADLEPRESTSGK